MITLTNQHYDYEWLYLTGFYQKYIYSLQLLVMNTLIICHPYSLPYILTSYQLSQSLTGQRQNFPRKFQILKKFCLHFCNVKTRFTKMEDIYMSGEGLCGRKTRQLNAELSGVMPDVWPP